jgi:carbamoyltransferase
MGYHDSNQKIVDYLKTFKICGLARGRAEFGPRALGNRSLIADPRGLDIKEKVNDIKHRERFRPFAPAILAEHAHEFFDIPNGRSSDYMQMVYRCRRPNLFPAIVHHDGTSRVQTVQAGSGQFRELLELWYAETGCPMLLNTSLNIKGQPMVNTFDDAELWTKTYGLPILG